MISGSKPPARRTADPHEGVAAAGFRVADGGIPLQVGEPVVDALLGVAFRQRPATAGSSSSRTRGRARSIGRIDLTQSPSTNWTYRTPGETASSRSRPEFRALAAENGRDMSRSTTSTPIERAIATLPSVEPEST
ncbi:MAG: hypothetical protein U0800_15680 [Isosphaeraceae bacterium]